MAQINFKFDGYDYTLEYTRKSAAALQAAGFDDNKIDTQPLVMIPMLFKFAFMAHHRNIRTELVDKIFNSIGNKEDLVRTLAEMYYAAVSTLADEPEDSGKVEWTVSG